MNYEGLAHLEGTTHKLKQTEHKIMKDKEEEYYDDRKIGDENDWLRIRYWNNPFHHMVLQQEENHVFKVEFYF